MYTNIKAQPKNNPIKKKPIDNAQTGRKIWFSSGQKEIIVKFKFDKVNIEKKIRIGIVNV